MPYNEIHPIPTEDDYERAFHAVRERVVIEGGIRMKFVLHGLTARTNEVVAADDERIGKFGAFLAPPTLGFVEDESHEVRSAYVHGYRLAHQVAESLYEGPYAPSYYLRPIQKWQESIKTYDFPIEEEFYRASRQRVVKYGRAGLDRIGYDAMEIFRDIASDAYPGAGELAASMLLGGGSLILAGEHMQNATNEALVQRAMAQLNEGIDLDRLFGQSNGDEEERDG